MLRTTRFARGMCFAALISTAFVIGGCASTVVPSFEDASERALDAADITARVDAADRSDVRVVEFALCDGGRCADDERLNAWTKQCQSLAVAYPPRGGDIGDPCMTEADCRSAGHVCPIDACIWQGGNGVQGGYCLSPCTLTETPFGRDRFPQSDCPTGALCLPHPGCVSGSEGSGDCVRTGACVRECQSDSDCRVSDGFYCRRTHFDPTLGTQRMFQNGYCAPAHCESRGCLDHFGCGC
jgi:hypothetical protein